MVNQINPAGSPPAPSAAALLSSVVARPAPARAALAPAPQAGTATASVAQVNQHLQQSQTDLKLEVDPGSGRTVFQIVQQGTGQLVMQIPSEEVLGMSRRIQEMETQTSNTGALVDKKG